MVLAVWAATIFIAGASSGKMNPSVRPRSSAASHWSRYASRSGVELV
jgi:hypothetical protein